MFGALQDDLHCPERWFWNWLASLACRCASSWLSTTMSSSAGASSISPSPSSNLCRGMSVRSSRTRPIHVRHIRLVKTRVNRPSHRYRPQSDFLKGFSKLRHNVFLFFSKDVVPECEKSSATTYYWYREALNISNSISEGGGLNWKMTVCLLVAWSIVCLAMIKGIQSSGKASPSVWIVCLLDILCNPLANT